MMKSNMSNPIVFGKEFPKLRLRFEYGSQFVYSTTNFNLYIDLRKLNDNGTYPIAALFDRDYSASEEGSGGEPTFVRNEGLAPPHCEIDELKPCPMLLEDWAQRDYKDDSGRPRFKLNSATLRDRPQLHSCKLISALIDCLDAPAERRFAEVYYAWLISGWNYDYNIDKHQINLRKGYGKITKQWHEQQLHLHAGPRSPAGLCRTILESLESPALIPQVWLNYTYEEKEVLGGAPSRVDFLFIRQNKLHVVEIDGPSHYATYDESTRKYTVDEQRYTDNLRVERALQKQGIEIHRFSNWEILNTTESELIRLIRDVLGVRPSRPIESYPSSAFIKPKS